MKKTKFSEVNDFQACENYVVLPNDEEAKNYCEMAQELQISILVLDNTTISQRNKIQNSIRNTNLDILSPSSTKNFSSCLLLCFSLFSALFMF